MHRIADRIVSYAFSLCVYVDNTVISTTSVHEHLHVLEKVINKVLFTGILNCVNRNYCSSERECLGIVHALTILKPYLLGTDSAVTCDYRDLIRLRDKANLKSRIITWLTLFQQFFFGIKYVQGGENWLLASSNNMSD
jgi:hypothetical protein